jgi:DNA invertase Pin-like site-specific DNA recombinase
VTIAKLQDRGVQIKSLTEPDIDTTTPMGRALFGFVAVLAQLRVDTIRENTRRGLAHARSGPRRRPALSHDSGARGGRRQHALRTAEHRDDRARARCRCPSSIQARQRP